MTDKSEASVKSRIGTSLILFLIFFVLFASYSMHISTDYAYMGFSHDFSGVFLVVSLLVVLIYCSTVALVKKEYLCFFALMYFIFFLAPSSILAIYDERAIEPFFIIFISFFMFLFLIGFMPAVRIAKVSSEKGDFFIFLASLALFLVVVKNYGVQVNLDVFLFDDIYSTRYKAAEMHTPLAKYSYFWLAKFFGPLLILIGLDRKKMRYAAFGVAVMSYLFMITAIKSVLLTMLVVFAFYVISKLRGRYLVNVAIGFFVGVFVFFAANFFMGVSTLESMFVRRMMFLPSLLNVFYFDFFSNDNLYYSASFLSFLGGYEYELLPPNLIGMEYFDDAHVMANNGIFSDGVINLGYAGVFLNVLVASYVLKVIYSSGVPRGYYGLIFLFFYSIQGTAMSTVFVTHGAVFMIIYLSIFRFERGR